MDNNININEQLKLKNQEMLLNKKKIDLDTAMESLIVFFENYGVNLTGEINNQIALFKKIESESEQGKIMYNTINSFYYMLSKKLRDLIEKKTKKIKEKLNTISDEEYNKELRYMSISISNQLLEYYSENIGMLIEEIAVDTDNMTKDRISSYLLEVIYGRIMNMLSDKLTYSIRVISNNYEENYQKIESINEKTLNKV